MRVDEKVNEIIQQMANALVTSGCGGHHKANMNENYVRSYKRELEQLGAVIPSKNELYEIGKFNGEGAY